MEADCYVYFKFKNRKTGEFTDAYLAFKNVEDKDAALKQFFDIHDYKIVDKKLVSRETYDNWRREKRPLLVNKNTT